MLRRAVFALALLATAPAAAECVDLNTARLEELTTLPHVGTARAEQIVEGRPWAHVPDLRAIHGIGPARLYDIRTDGRACIDGEDKIVLRGPARVLDGDTIVVQAERMRFLGMDAPEGDQWCEVDGLRWSCGDASTAALVDLIASRELECRAPDRDRYGRPLAVCHRDDGLELNREMVRLGWALVYRPGSDPFPRPEYEAEEAEAREAGRGMWQGTFTVPSEWRSSR